MEIKLLIDDKEKTFAIPFVPARKLREALELNKSIDFNNLDTDGLDKMVSYVVDLFKNQFTIDDFYDGLPASEMIPTITRCINEVVKGDQEPKN